MVSRRRFGKLLTTTSAAVGVAIMPGSFAGRRQFHARAVIDEDELFGKVGHIGLRAFVDVDNDGEKEFIMNIGSEADFAALKLSTLSTVWRSTQNQTKGKMAYFPQIIDGETAVAYGHRADDTVYCINLSDGSLRWSYTANGSLQSIEQTNYGLVVGSNGTGGEVTVLSYSGGSVLSGWPVSFTQHEQLLGAGDLDGDGDDEIVLNDNSGSIEVRNRDGSLLFSIASSHGHVDQHYIGDIDPNSAGRELLTVVDDDASSNTDEGDELVTYDEGGSRINSHTLSQPSPNIAAGNIHPGRSGTEIAYGLEGADELGVLDGSLSLVWSRTINSKLIGSGGVGQVSLGDIDGDDDAEIIVNTDETVDSGFIVYSKDGDYVGRLYGWGWDTDPLNSKKNSETDANRFVDVDGDGRDEYHASQTAASDTSTNDVIRVIEHT